MKPRRLPATNNNPHALRASGDRWLFGYADVVTLLFACFASLYATTLAPSAKVPQLDVRLDAPAPVAPPEVTTLAQALTMRLGSEGTLPGLEVTSSSRGLVISLPEAGSFPPGRAELSDRARAAILGLAESLRDLPGAIRVEGHTDDRPINTADFASNWDLSTARATRVVRFLVEDGGLSPARLAAAGYAEYRPRLPNSTPDARARNRRVDIVVLDHAVAQVEEPGNQP
jgi:chemotaxis protein MotB